MLKSRKHDRDVELKHYLNNQKDIKRMQESIDRLNLITVKTGKRAESKEKALERMEKVERPEVFLLVSVLHLSLK